MRASSQYNTKSKNSQLDIQDLNVVVLAGGVGGAKLADGVAQIMPAENLTIIVNTGTYEINGSMVTFRPIIAKSPGFVGGHQTSTFRVDGDTLVLTLETVVAVDGVSAPNANVSGSLTFVRVE